ncbi:helix-turn-helix domain-containing protein [Halostagnicola sp. A56]|uniref:helix-turn-helix domain-containing protein n=1 Tax=Halostagnicola sp. A56 TaxID=1495067 RepID=UPI0018CE5F81|nr:helix-turn-helix domain-containing protein [Halostagnicola sp. A56]
MSSAQATDGGERPEKTLTVGETTAGEPYELPVEDILTGRLFATGKSGAGKSNTGSVIAEELLERGHPLLIVDVDGEYWGLKETYEVLHVGATDECDLQVTADHAGKLAELALEQHVPIVLDVSGYVDGDDADALVRETARELFAKEQQAMQPFLLLVEEIHEYIPQQGSAGDVGDVLTRIAKRGRKRGLGIAGFSQRPADVDKAFITQADCLVWHRLTWGNDVDVVRDVIGAEHADAVSSLEDGEAFVQADWDETDVETVQFRRKRTFDAGATPGLDDVDRPDLKSIDEDLVDELAEISDAADQRRDEVARLEQRLEEKDDRIEELKQERDQAQDVSNAATQLAEALSGGDTDDVGVPEDFEDQLESKNEEIANLRDRVDGLEDELADVQNERDELATEVERLRGIEDRVDEAERIEDRMNEIEAWFASAPAALRDTDEKAQELFATVGDQDVDDEVAELRSRLQDAQETIQQLQHEKERLEETNDVDGPTDLGSLVQHDAVQSAVDVAKDNCDRSGEHVDRMLAVLASSDGGPLSVGEIEPLTEGSETTVRQACKALFEAGVVRRESDGRAHAYALDEDFLERRIQVAEQQVG